MSDPARGQVLSLDGIDDAVEVPLIGEADEITISMWINPLDVVTPSDFKSTYHSHDWAAGDVHWRLRFGVLNGGINGIGDLNGLALIANGQWHHVVLTLSSTQFAFWVNGLGDITQIHDTAAPITVGEALIGAWLTGGTVDREFVGMIDDVRIYDRALSQAEILGLAGKTAPVIKPF